MLWLLFIGTVCAQMTTNSSDVIYLSDANGLVTCTMLRSTPFDTLSDDLKAAWMQCMLAHNSPALSSLAGARDDEAFRAGQRQQMRDTSSTIAAIQRDMEEKRRLADEKMAEYERAKVAHDAEMAAEAERAAAHKETVTTYIDEMKRNQIDAERSRMLRESITKDYAVIEKAYNEHHDVNLLNADMLAFKLRWNDTYNIAYPGLNGETIPLITEEQARYAADPTGDPLNSMGSNVKMAIAEKLQGYHDYISDPKVKAYYINMTMSGVYDATKDNVPFGPWHENESAPTANHMRIKHLNMVKTAVHASAYSEAKKKLDEMQMELHITTENERMREKAEALNSLVFKESMKAAADLMDIEFHEREARARTEMADAMRKHLYSNPHVVKYMHPQATIQDIMDAYMNTTQTQYKKEMANVKRQGYNNLFEYAISFLSNDTRMKLEHPLREAHVFSTDPVFWDSFKNQLERVPVIVQEKIAQMQNEQSMWGADDELNVFLPPHIRRQFSKEAGEKVKNDVAAAFRYTEDLSVYAARRTFMPHMHTPTAFSFAINKTTVINAFISFLNDTIFGGCQASILVPPYVYCFPFIDPNSPGLPYLPVTLNITNRLPVVCDTHLANIHGSVGLLDGSFQKLGDFLSMIMTYSVCFAINLPWCWTATDPRRNVLMEIIMCGLPIFFLFLAIFFTFIIIFPYFLEACLKTTGLYADFVRDSRITILEKNMVYVNTRFGPSMPDME